MKGTITQINRIRGMVAVATESDGYSVFELLGGDSVELGDAVSWKDDTALGSEVLTNHTQGERYEVYFQNHHVNQQLLRQQLLY